MFSAMQQPYLPGQPVVERSEMPGIIWKMFMITRRIARPMVALARLPGPNTLTLAFIPISSRISPEMITTGAEPPVLAVEPWKL